MAEVAETQTQIQDLPPLDRDTTVDVMKGWTADIQIQAKQLQMMLDSNRLPAGIAEPYRGDEGHLAKLKALAPQVESRVEAVSAGETILPETYFELQEQFERTMEDAGTPDEKAVSGYCEQVLAVPDSNGGYLGMNLPNAQRAVVDLIRPMGGINDTQPGTCKFWHEKLKDYNTKISETRNRLRI
jgi:hypothetical protein